MYNLTSEQMEQELCRRNQLHNANRALQLAAAAARGENLHRGVPVYATDRSVLAMLNIERGLMVGSHCGRLALRAVRVVSDEIITVRDAVIQEAEDELRRISHTHDRNVRNEAMYKRLRQQSGMELRTARAALRKAKAA